MQPYLMQMSMAQDALTDSSPAQGLADASADLMQSLDKLLGSLEGHSADSPDTADLQHQQDEAVWVPGQEHLEADPAADVEPEHTASAAETGGQMTVQCKRNSGLWAIRPAVDRAGLDMLSMHPQQRRSRADRKLSVLCKSAAMDSSPGTA